MSASAPKRPPRLAEGKGSLGRLLSAVGEPAPPPAARDRVWRRLALGSPRPRLSWLALPALAGALGAAAWLLLSVFSSPPRAPAPRCTLSFAAGEVETGLPGGRWTAAEAGAPLPWGTGVQTAEDSRAFVRVLGSGVLLSAASQLQLREGADGVEVVVLRGAAAVLTDAQPPLVVVGAYSVRAADASLGVASSTEGVVVWVRRGSADVLGPGLARHLAAGEWWSSGGAGPPPASAMEEQLAVALVARAASEAPLRVAGAQSLQVTVDGLAVGRPPLWLLAAAGRHRVVGTAGAAEARREALVEPGRETLVTLRLLELHEAEPRPPEGLAHSGPAERSRGPLDRLEPSGGSGTQGPVLSPSREGVAPPARARATPPPPEVRAAPAPETGDAVSARGARAPVTSLSREVPRAEATPEVPPGDAVEALQGRARAAAPGEREELLYQLAGLLAQRARYGEAVAVYESLAQGTGPRAELSLYQTGRLRARSLGDAEGAWEAFADYRRRFPRGALGQEVQLALIELQLGASQLDGALREIDAFLAAWPASERRAEVVLLRAKARREQGDCARALVDFAALAASPGAVGDDAAYFAASCEQAQGQLGAARQRLQRYLEQHPRGRHAAEARAALGP